MADGRHRPVVLFGPSQVGTCDVGFPARSRAGDPGFLEKARTQRVAGGCPPAPLFRARSFPLAGFGVVGRSGAVGAISQPIYVP